MRTFTAELAQKLPDSSVSLPANAGALVMGGDHRGLALVRSLGRMGVPVWVINQFDQLLGGTSRYAHKTFFYPEWKGERAVNFLLEIGHKWSLKGWMLFPTSDQAVRLVSTYHREFAELFQVTVPPWATLQRLVDKRQLEQLAHELGIDCPQTLYVNDREELAAAGLTYPVVLKPATRHHVNRLTVDKAWRADDLPTLASLYNEARQYFTPDKLMIQELIPGGGDFQFSFAAICHDGLPLASLVARRTRQFPTEFGRASTFVETVDDPGIAEASVTLLKAIRYEGLVEVEFKKDPRDGKLKLLDVNPRVWGWYSLCEAAGVNFGYLMWLLHNDLPVPSVHARVGACWARLTTDFLACINEIRKGRLGIHDFVHSRIIRKQSAIFAWDDPLPGVLEIPLLFYMFGSRIFQNKKCSVDRKAERCERE